MIGLRILFYGALGTMTAVIYVSALAWNVRLYLGDSARWRPLLVHITRILVIVAAFTFCAFQGALALLSSLAGFHIIRTVAVRRQTIAAEKTA